jgi:CBS domain containing-hemolysin-like protein
VIEGYLRETHRLLGTTLVGTNLSLVISSTLASNVAARYGGPMAQAGAGVFMSLTLLIFSEYLPKVWFNSRPIERCLPLAPLLRLAERAFKPLASLVLLATRWVSPRRQKQTKSPFITRENIQTLARDSQAGGQISAFEHLMISRVLNLQMQTSRQVMTPLARVTRVHADDRLETCFERAKSSGHMRLPVFDVEDRVCLGILPVIDVLSRNDLPSDATAANQMRPPFFVSPDLQADDLLPMMRRNRQPLAIVKDQEGCILGLVTQENILAAIMGNLSTGDRIATSP